MINKKLFNTKLSVLIVLTIVITVLSTQKVKASSDYYGIIAQSNDLSYSFDFNASKSSVDSLNSDYSGIIEKVSIVSDKIPAHTDRMYYDDDDYFGINYNPKFVPIISEPLSDHLSGFVSGTIHYPWPKKVWHVFDIFK